MAATSPARDVALAPQEAVEQRHRNVTLTVPRVEVRLYRSSRTSSDPIKRPPHFVYVLRCDWSQLDAGWGKVGLPGGSWWDALPQTYTVRRRWIDIVRFHEVLKSELSFDSSQGCRRVRARVPDLPDRGQLDKFVVGVAATGDACALSRSQKHSDSALEDLDDLHFIYVENRLAPYFADVNKVLAELPAELLRTSAAFRKFVTAGVGAASGPHPEGFCGPGPSGLDRATVAAAAGQSRKAAHGDGGGLGTPGGQHPAEGGRTGKRQATHGAAPAAAAPRKAGAGDRAKPSGPGRPSGLLPRSSSAPPGAAAAPGVPADPGPEGLMERTLRPEETMQHCQQRRASMSHYSYFARSLPRGEFFGCDSGRDLWKRMSLKEGRQLGRRTLCHAGAEEPPRRRTLERLPALPPPSPSEVPRALDPPVGSPGGRQRASARNEAPSRAPPARPERARAEPVARDICEGLRILMLGDQPSQVPRSMRRNEPLQQERAEASREEVLKVYRLYRGLLELRAGDEPEESSSDGDEGREARARGGEAAGRPRRGGELPWSASGLAPVSWSALFSWVRNRGDLAEVRLRAVCAALIRALKDWRLAQAGRAPPGAGVHLSQIFQWIWPSLADGRLATLFTWICLVEVERVRQPTPRVIEGQEAARLEKIFRQMSGSEGRDFVTPEEIAGGRDQAVDAKLKNIVDRETVVAVCGDREIQRTEFMELMCEDNFRAHEGAGQVILQDRRRLVRQRRPDVGVDVWVLEEVEAEEAGQQLLVDALEAEVRRWRRRAELRLQGGAEAPAEAPT